MSKTLKAALLVSSAFIAMPVFAQTDVYPPFNYATDDRGVDLVTGAYFHTEDVVSVGDRSMGGLGVKMTFMPRIATRVEGWRDHNVGTATEINGKMVVSVGVQSESFSPGSSAGTWLSDQGEGATLFESSDSLAYTASDGTIAIFDKNLGGNIGSWDASSGVMRTLKRPDGTEATYTYEAASFCVWNESPCRSNGAVKRLRLQSVRTNAGYQISYQYAQAGAGGGQEGLDSGPWSRLVKVTAFNRGGDFCDSTANNCSFSLAWPSATFSSAQYGDTGEQFSSIENALGEVTHFSYEYGNLKSVTRPGDTKPSIVISTATTDGEVASWSNGLDTYTYKYSDYAANAPYNRTITVTDPNGNRTIAVSNLREGTLTSLTSPSGDIRTLSYDSKGRLKRAAGQHGEFVEYTYDERGNVIQSLFSPKTGSGLSPIYTSATYASSCVNVVTCNLPLSVTDSRGFTTDYVYDPGHGGVTQIVQPAPVAGAPRPTTSFGYGAFTALVRNGQGQTIAAGNPIVRPTTISRCASAAVCADSVNESRTTFSYSSPMAFNNLLPTVITDGDGTGALAATTTYAYSLRGDVERIDGPLNGDGDARLFLYDRMRRLHLARGAPIPTGSGAYAATRYARNARGEVTLIERGTSTDEGESFSPLQAVSTVYDLAGRPTHRRFIAGGVTHSLVQISYDASGRQDCVATRMNPSTFANPPSSACSLDTAGAFGPDRITKYNYDAAGRVTSTVSGYGSGSEITESATYTANGKPQTLTDGAGNVSTLVYDGFDRLSQMRYPNASGGGSSTTDYEEYGYDAGSNVISYRNRGGEVISADYDALNRQVSMGGSAIADRTVAYDLLNRVTAVSYAGGGAGATRTWDALGRMTSETQNGVGTMSYGYDLAGRRTAMQWPDGFWVAYDYNTAGDLTAVRENGATNWALASWAYDNLGRPIAQSRANGATTTWGYDAAGRLSSLSQDLAGTAKDLTVNLGYNPAGQIVSRSLSNSAYAYTPGSGTTTYANNGKNQVTAVSGNAVSYDGRQNITGVPGQGGYGYNGSNELTSATVGGTTTGLSYDPAGRLYQTGSTRFLYDGEQVVGEYNTSGGLLRRYVPGLGLDSIVTAYEGSGYDRRWLLADERGSVVSITDGSAGALATNTYDEYGVPGAGNSGRFQYTGQMWLPEAQLYHYRARAYAPQLGRFMQTDPIGYQAGANLYAYVGGDPINWRDPFGLQKKQRKTCIGVSVHEDCEPDEVDSIEVVGRRAGFQGVSSIQASDGARDRDSSQGSSEGDRSQRQIECESYLNPGDRRFTCDAHGRLHISPDYQRQICANYEALQDSADRINDTLQAVSEIPGVGPALSSLMSWSGVIAQATTGGGYQPFGLTLIPKVKPGGC